MKVLHISDLHLVMDGKDAERQQHLKNRYIDFVGNCIDIDVNNSPAQIDQIIITGDLRNHSDSSEPYISANYISNFIYEIMDATNISNARDVHIIPGNHDLKRGNNLNSWADKDAQFDVFFRCFCDIFYGQDLNPWLKLKENQYCTIETRTKEISLNNSQEKLGFLYINSALDCVSSKTDKGNLHLHPDVYELFTPSLNDLDYIFILTHHPHDWIHPASLSELYKIISERIEDAEHRLFWVSGHNHDTDSNTNEFPGRPPISIGSMMGVHGQHYELPDFSIYNTLNEKAPISVYRFLPHLNMPSFNPATNSYLNQSPAEGGWKLIPVRLGDPFPAQSALSGRKYTRI